LIASLFAILIAASVFTLAYNVIHSWLRGETAVANEWGAKTLEWAVPTPVPLENFEGELPVIASLPYNYGSPMPELPVTPEPEVDISTVAIEAPTQAQGED
jgi:cytochrome c oxidase subunit 1